MQAHVFISGLVQGVSFRYFIKINANKLSLTGWVRNTDYGAVEAVFSGEKEKIEEMIELCRKGPVQAEVEKLGFEWEKPEGFEGFKIKD